MKKKGKLLKSHSSTLLLEVSHTPTSPEQAQDIPLTTEYNAPPLLADADSASTAELATPPPDKDDDSHPSTPVPTDTNLRSVVPIADEQQIGTPEQAQGTIPTVEIVPPTETIACEDEHAAPPPLADADSIPIDDIDTVDEPIEEQANKLPSDTLPLPAFQLRYITLKDVKADLHKQVKTPTANQNAPKVSLWQRVKTTDKWLVATFMLACIASGLSLWYFFAMHQTLLYGDANAHLLIARRVLDNLTPGLAQLGAIWLPLPHLLMVPLVWNDFLWRTGLAGSIVSMLCYLIATVYIFLSARRLTNNSLASFLGTLVFILNPNMLYLQSTPLSELVFVATLAATCYYFLVWAQTDSTKYLILTAGAMLLTTLFSL